MNTCLLRSRRAGHLLPHDYRPAVINGVTTSRCHTCGHPQPGAPT